MSASIDYRAGRIALLLFLGLSLLAGSAIAQQAPPRLLSYQGVLTNSKRSAVPDGEYTVTFRLYDAATGGLPLWEETNTVRTIGGVFESILGARTPLRAPFDRSYWVSLAVQGDVEMTPRIPLLASPYAIRSIVADTAMHLAPGASGVVRSINSIDGNLVLVGEGGASVRASGDTIAIVVPEAADATVATSARLAGNGSASAPLDIARMGAANGQPLVWSDATGSWGPGAAGVQAQAPLRGTGTPADPLGLTNATTAGALLYWDGTGWKAATPRAPIAGELLRWNAASKRWEPAGVAVSEDGDLGIGGNLLVGRNLTVNGTIATLPAKSVDNTELANSMIGITYGDGIMGDDSVALGGELALRNTGVTRLGGTPNQVLADTSRGAVTLSLPQDIHAGARPIFAGVTLSAVPSASLSDTLLVSNGGAVQSRTVASLIPSFARAYWGAKGNAGTTPGTDFIGTTDDQALQVHVGNGASNGADGRGRVMRYEPNATSANIIGGYSGNSVAAGVTGAVIGGGGSNNNINSISSSFAMVGGGNQNHISTGASHAAIVSGNVNTIQPGAARSVISGGARNTIDTNATQAVISGGARNRVASFNAVISGGSDNAVNASSSHSAIAGGSDNTIGAGSYESTIGAGNLNTIGNGSQRGTIGGGSINTIEGSAPSATISGGYANAIRFSSESATIGGGMSNTIDSSADGSIINGGKSNMIGKGASYAVIAGGERNTIDTNASLAVIAGGINNRVAVSGGVISGGDYNTVQSPVSAIAGGSDNTIGTGSYESTIGAGNLNTIGNGSQRGTIGGGSNGIIEGSTPNATISGGYDNVIRFSSGEATIGGGMSNRIDSSADGAIINGGKSNMIGNGASYAVIAGGRGLTLSGAGSFGFLGANTNGTRNMQVTAANTAVFGNTTLWLASNNNTPSQLRFFEAYNTAGAFPNTANYSSFEAQTQTADINYVLPATIGGVGDQLTISAVAGTRATLAWALPSDRRLKTDFLTLDGESLLGRFRGLELGTWRYTHDADDRRHYGIMAQDFHRLFGSDGVGTIGTDTTVNNLDMMGVSYLAIQALEARTARGQSAIEELASLLKAQGREMEALRDEVRALREENSALRQEVR